jgi:2-keto-3-deoxy-L-rhamnonate aldolase RhmA
MKLRQRLGREPLAALWMTIGSTTIVELAAAAGADAIIIDAQHGLWDRKSLESAVAATASASALVRVAENSAVAIGQALDTGAEGVIVPLIEDATEAAAAVAAARFPPIGHRSGGGVRPIAGGFFDYCASANERTVLGVMIETARGVDNAAEIARTPGVDFVLIGTGDLALSLGGDAARHKAACSDVLQACDHAQIPCATFTMTVEEAIARVAEGYAMVIAANDIMIVSRGFGDAMHRFRSEVSAAPAAKGRRRAVKETTPKGARAPGKRSR